MNAEFFTALELLESENGISKEYMISQIELALANACRKEVGPSTVIRVQLDPVKKDMRVFQQRTVVPDDEVYDDKREIGYTAAKALSRRHKMGGVVETELKTKDFRRLSATAGKQMIVQAIRTAERERQTKEYENKKEEIITAIVDKVDTVNGSAILGAIQLQRNLEHAAYVAGGGDFYAPIMTLGDFLQGKRGSEPTRVQPSYRDGKVRVSDFENIFPSFVLSSLRYGFSSFGKKIKGYDAPDTVLTAAETRTSAPLRILRDPQSMRAIGHEGIYPCGEGAGYAGGITSAAVDGVRVAMALMENFAAILK